MNFTTERRALIHACFDNLLARLNNTYKFNPATSEKKKFQLHNMHSFTVKYAFMIHRCMSIPLFGLIL